MVGRRNRSFYAEGGKNNGTGSNGDPNTKRNNDDLENGPAPANGNGNKPRIFKFKDVAHTALEDSRREELKKQLLFGLEQVDLEKFRKSEEDVGVTFTFRYRTHANLRTIS